MSAGATGRPRRLSADLTRQSAIVMSGGSVEGVCGRARVGPMRRANQEVRNVHDGEGANCRISRVQLALYAASIANVLRSPSLTTGPTDRRLARRRWPMTQRFAAGP